MSKRCRSDKNHRFSGAATDETAAIMDTSIGSDGERSDNDYDAEDVTPSTTPVSDIGAKLANGQRSNNFVFNLKFSIENILKPDFGRQQRNGVRGGVSDTSGSPPTFPATPSPLSSPQCMTSAARGVNGRTSTSENLLSAINTPSVGSGNPPPTPGQTGTPASLWPAWVYCTRYSDRPSSGKCAYIYQFASGFDRRPNAVRFREGRGYSRHPRFSTASIVEVSFLSSLSP